MNKKIHQILASLKTSAEQRLSERSQSSTPLDFTVVLPAPANRHEQYRRWHLPQEWCLQHVTRAEGLWSRHRDKQTGELIFTFSEEDSAALFRLRFN